MALSEGQALTNVEIESEGKKYRAVY